MGWWFFPYSVKSKAASKVYGTPHVQTNPDQAVKEPEAISHSIANLGTLQKLDS